MRLLRFLHISGCRQHVGTTQKVRFRLSESAKVNEVPHGSPPWSPMAGSRAVYREQLSNMATSAMSTSPTIEQIWLNSRWCEYFSQVEHKLNLSETVWMFEEPTSQIEFLSDFLWSLAHGIWSHTLTNVTWPAWPATYKKHKSGKNRNRAASSSFVCIEIVQQGCLQIDCLACFKTFLCPNCWKLWRTL